MNKKELVKILSRIQTRAYNLQLDIQDLISELEKAEWNKKK